MVLWLVVFFNAAATTEIYTYGHTLPYTTLFRSGLSARDRQPGHRAGRLRAGAGQLSARGTAPFRFQPGHRPGHHQQPRHSVFRRRPTPRPGAEGAAAALP